MLSDDGYVLIDGNACQGAVEVPDGVTTIADGAFAGALMSAITLPDSLQTIGNNAFEDTVFSEIALPRYLVSVGSEAFKNATNLNLVAFLGATAPTVSVNAFTGVADDAHAYGNWDEPSPGYGIPYTRYCADGGGIDIDGPGQMVAGMTGSGCTGRLTIPPIVNKIGINAFANSDVTSLSLPETLVEIDDYAFLYSTHLTSADLPESLTTIGALAFGYTSLTSITLPESATSLDDSVFAGIPTLTSVTLPSTLYSIPHGAFSADPALTAIDIPDNVHIIGDGAFHGDTALVHVRLGSGVEYIHSNAFRGTAIEQIDIPAGAIYFGDHVFAETPHLTRASFAPTSTLTSIPDGTFADSALVEVTLPPGLTAIGDEAFARTAFTSVDLPSTVTSIGADAFNGAALLAGVYFQGDAPSVGADAFSDVASGASAYFRRNATGFEDDPWHGLTLGRIALGVTVDGSGSVASTPAGVACSASCTGRFYLDDEVVLTATPAPGYVFDGWAGACSGSGTCTVAMSTERAVTARFRTTPADAPPSAASPTTPKHLRWSVRSASTVSAGTTITTTFAAAPDTTYRITATPLPRRSAVRGTCRIAKTTRLATCSISPGPGRWTIRITPIAHGAIGIPAMRRVTVAALATRPDPSAVTG